MTPRLEEYGRIEEELVALLRKLLAELPPNAASLEVRPVSNNGIVAVVKPTNPAAASIVTHAENGLHLIDFSFGEYEPTWELPIEGYNPNANKGALLLSRFHPRPARVGPTEAHTLAFSALRLGLWLPRDG